MGGSAAEPLLRIDGPILLTGATGQVGYELLRELSGFGQVHAPSRAELDLTQPGTLGHRIRELRPRLIVNAAAYTAVDRAESERELCMTINAEAPGVLADAARDVGAVFVHYSTDYVFDGEKHAPYVETDEPAPLNVYGESKLEGERAIAARGGAYLIFRTSWVYGSRGTNFLRTMLRLARERTELRVVNDQFGAPTWSRDIASGTARAITPIFGDADPLGAAASLAGVYHMTAAGDTTWHGFAESILAADPHRQEQRCERVVPVSSEEFPTAARRPKYSVLDNSLLRERFGISLPHWREAVEPVLCDCR